jgi:hypothetical protein
VETLEEKKHDMIRAGRLLTVDEVLQMWPISREYLSRLTHSKDEAMRIPCVMFGRKPLYPYDELMWWRDKHRFVPKRRGGKS